MKSIFPDIYYNLYLSRSCAEILTHTTLNLIESTILPYNFKVRLFDYYIEIRRFCLHVSHNVGLFKVQKNMYVYTKCWRHHKISSIKVVLGLVWSLDRLSIKKFCQSFYSEKNIVAKTLISLRGAGDYLALLYL